jgi:translation initiation factor 1
MGVKRMARSEKKRIQSGGDISMGGGEEFSVSIGSLLGSEKPARDVQNPPVDISSPVRQDTHHELSWSANRVILRRESAGRGGRTVTVVESRPPFDAKTAGELAKIMRKALGCGAHAEGTNVILQGDIQDRAEAWLKKQGVQKFVKGS